MLSSWQFFNPQPNCLVKLTPTGAACWCPPLRFGAAYRGR